VAPFDATGTYQGDGVVRDAAIAEGGVSGGTQPGAALTAGAGGVDVMQVIGRLQVAVAANDTAAMRAALGEVQGAVGQVANVRAEAGARRAVLLSADEARGAFEQRLDETIARAVEADPIAAVSELARSSAGLEAARAAANQLISLFQGVR
jgi:flagellin-like hook-associated protein FlgL